MWPLLCWGVFPLYPLCGEFFVSVFVSFILATLRLMEFPGKGSDPSHSCDLRGNGSNCSNAGSFNQLCQAGAKPVSWCCRDATNPIVGTPLWWVVFFYFVGLHLRHLQVLRLCVELELQLQLPSYITVTAMPDLSIVFDLHHTSEQCQILNPLSKTRDQTCILMDTSWVHNCWTWLVKPFLHL